MRFQGKTSLIFLFYCGTVSRETDEKMLGFFWFFGIKKWNWLMVSYMKLTWNYETAKFGQEKKIETDGTRLRRGRQFQFFFLTEFGRFHNFSQFHVWNHSQFHFLSQKTEKIPTFFASFTWNWPQKKKVRFIPKTFLVSNPRLELDGNLLWLTDSNTKCIIRL